MGGLVAAALSLLALATVFQRDDPGDSFTSGAGWPGQADSAAAAVPDPSTLALFGLGLLVLGLLGLGVVLRRRR